MAKRPSPPAPSRPTPTRGGSYVRDRTTGELVRAGVPAEPETPPAEER